MPWLLYVGSGFSGSCSVIGVDILLAIAVEAGALAMTVNSIEHGGQVGMVSERIEAMQDFFSILRSSLNLTLARQK